MDIRISEGWRKAYPEAIVGILAMVGVENPPEHFALAEHAHQLEDDLRSQWAVMARADLNQIPEFEAYRFRGFHKASMFETAPTATQKNKWSSAIETICMNHTAWQCRR